jgi:hypothetical protein
MSANLIAYLEMRQLDEVFVMNFLQDVGKVSDNCVGAAEVGNAGEVISYLENRDLRPFRAYRP